jgi:hypothetical protein
MKIWITTSSSRIHDRALAFEFDAVANPYIREINSALSFKSLGASLQEVLGMFIFDPEPTNRFKCKFSKKQKRVEIDMPIDRELFRGLNYEQRRALLGLKLVDELRIAAKIIGDKMAHEIPNMIEAVLSLNRRWIPGYDSEVEDLRIKLKEYDSIPKPKVEESAPYQIVIQFLEADFATPDEMWGLEESFSDSLGEVAEVDGNDIGGGKFNLFILTFDPKKALEVLERTLRKKKLLDKSAIGLRIPDEDEYESLWPKGKCFSL